MKYFLVLFLLTILSIELYADNTYYRNQVTQFSKMAFDESEVYDVKEVFLNFDKGNFILEEGQLYFTKPINGMIVSAVFFGKAKFDYQPNDYRSKFYLLRSYDSTEIHKELKEIFFVFGDSLGLKLKSELPKTVGSITEFKKDILKKFNNYLFRDGQQELPYFWMVKSVLDKKYFNYSLLIFNDINNSTYSFTVNQSIPFEVEFSSVEWHSSIGNYFHSDCFHHAEDHDFPIDTLERKEEIAILLNKTNFRQRTKSRTDALVQYTTVALVDDPRWIRFSIDPTAEFKSVKFNSSKELDWFKKTDYSTLLIGLPDGIKKGDTFQLQFEYEGRMMERSGEYAQVNYWNLWCPRYSYNTKISYDVTVTFPMHFSAICTDPNAIIKESVNDGERTYNFKTPRPLESFFFTYAVYKTKEIKYEHGLIKMYYTTIGQADEALELAKAIANSCYQKIGPIVLDTINMVESDGSYVSNNFIIFPTNRISNYTNTEFQDFLICKNLIDYWLNNNIHGKIDKEDPLLQSMVLYLSCLFFNKHSKNVKDLIPKFIKSSKREIIKYRRNIKFSDNTVDCFIPVGFQPDRFNDEIGYWIFRMMHYILTDDKTLNDSEFFSILSDFYKTYQGKKVSYLEFWKFFQSKTDEDVSWFFKQWVFDSYIPTYKYTYKTIKKSDNEFVATLKVKQSNVPQNFQMIMPITVVFENGNKYRLRALIKGEKGENKDYCEFDLPILPYEIDKIILDEDDIILSEKEDVDWEDI